MIKAAGRTGLGVPLLLLGLSGENVTRLAAGEPVRVPVSDMRQLGLPAMEVVIHYGRTEQDIVDEFRAHGLTLTEAPPRPAGSGPHQ
jgi:hypothetical protein